MTDQTQEAVNEVPNPTGVTIQDIAMAVQVIDLAAERGGFKGPEMEVIGGLRGRLAEFVAANQPPAEEGEASAGEGEAA